MQLNDLQELIGRLKENKDMQVETTTLGRFLGSDGNKVSVVLGREVLNRPVLVSTRENNIQILDLKSGFVISISNSEEMLPKIVETFSRDRVQRPKIAAKTPNAKEAYQKAISKESGPTGHSQLTEFRDTMYKSGSIQDRMALVTRTIEILEGKKASCENGEYERICKAQGKLQKIITYSESKKLAPGQIPSVYEIAIWEWVN